MSFVTVRDVLPLAPNPASLTAAALRKKFHLGHEGARELLSMAVAHHTRKLQARMTEFGITAKQADEMLADEWRHK